jgi:hypothetical protein
MDFVERSDWGARNPKQAPTPLPILNPGLAVHWEGPHMGDFPHDACASKVRSVQDFHMDVRGWNDIAYNWVVCPHGFVFVGRGQNIRSAAQGTNDGNSGFHAVCFLGGVDDIVPDVALNALYSLKEYLNPTVVRAHCFFRPTDCPGGRLRAWIEAGCPQPVEFRPAPTENNIPTASHPTHPVLQEGSTGAEVKFLQARLNAAHASKTALKVDGVFGKKTGAAVRSFQSVHGLAVDGVVGPHTWGAIL